MATLKTILPPLPATRELLKIYELSARKQLSQNFLLDMNITRKIIKYSGNLKTAHVCEVGPGPGCITRAILEQDVKSLDLIEKDSRFFPALQLIGSATKTPLKIHHEDVLKFNFEKTFDESARRSWHDKPPDVHLIGNLPFSIATPLVVQLLRDMCLRTGIFTYGRCPLVLTFQKEVGQRMVAEILNFQRCRLSVMCQTYAHVQKCFEIPGCAFVPQPKIDVFVMKLIPLEMPKIRLHFDLIEKFCRHLFHYRQKKCIRCLETLFPPEYEEKFSHEILRRARVSPAAKSTAISIEEIGDMCQVYNELCIRVPGLFAYNYRGCKSDKEGWRQNQHLPPQYPFADETNVQL